MVFPCKQFMVNSPVDRCGKDADKEPEVLQYGAVRRRPRNSLFVFLGLCGLFVTQFVWYIGFTFAVSDWHVLRQVQLGRDSLLVLVSLLPTFLVIVLSVRKSCIAIRERRTRFAVAVALFAITSGVICLCAFDYWYNNILLNRGGNWGMW